MGRRWQRAWRTGGLAKAGARALLGLGAVALASCAATRSVEEVLDSSEDSAPGRGAVKLQSPLESTVDPAALPEAAPAPGGLPAPASPGPEPERTLAGPEELGRLARLQLEASTLECTTLLESARAENASYEVLMATARALILNADLRLQSTLAFGPDEASLPAPEDLIDLEDDVSGELKSEIRSLATSSADFALRALELRPGDPAAKLFSTLGTGLRLWSLPTLQALASGAATTLPGQIKALAAEAPEFEGASPLRLKGRFQSRAPWPFKDLEGGRASLEAAVEAAPIPLNLLFLGDAHWLCGDTDRARARWREATTAEADAETEDAAPFIREIARLRLASASGR